MAKGNGGLKVATGLLTGLVLLLSGALANTWAKASNHISRLDAQSMVDRGDDAIEKRLERIETKIDQLISAQGGE